MINNHRTSALLLAAASFALTFTCPAQQQQTNTIGISGSTPWVNAYHYYNYYEQKQMNEAGFVGLGAGGYWRNKNNKITIDVAVTLNAMFPFGDTEYAPDGIRDNIFTNNIELIYHRRVFHKLYVLAGPNWVNYHFRLSSGVDSVRSYTKSDQTFGLTVGAAYELIKPISVAVLYRPTIISIDHKQYWHQIGLSVRFDLALLKW
jgi:opacity protein-like surface antigen